MANRSLTVNGGNLFMIALQQLGDATQWNRIAQASGTGPDPFLPTGVATVLSIPPRDTAAGGGVYDPPGSSVFGLPVVIVAPPRVATWGTGRWGVDVWGS